MNGKNARIISALGRVSALVGEKPETGDGAAGLGLTLESGRCLEEIRNMENGLFRVVVTGTFTCGKSTLVNALLGSRVLPVSALPSTAVLTFVRYGEDSDEVEIHFRDTVNADGSVTAGGVERVKKEVFATKYRYTAADNEEFARTGRVERFRDVAYSVVRCPLELVGDGVTIVDSPGLEDKSVATELALDTAARAQAVVYMCGERGFSEADREYFRDSFRGNPGNVFFVLNKTDNIASDRERREALERVKNDVKICFQKADGSTDTDMMEKRVFGLSALAALEARTGTAFDTNLQKDVALDAGRAEEKLERSGFPPFEEALREFLTTDERCTAQYSKVFRTMTAAYDSAVDKVRRDRADYEKNGREIAAEHAGCARVIREIETCLGAAEASFYACTLKLQTTLASLVRGAVDGVEDTWETDLAELREKVRFGMRDYLSLALTNINVFKSREAREEDVRRLLQPFSEIIAGHISGRIDRFMEANSAVLDSAVREAEESVNAGLDSVAGLFSQLGGALTEAPQLGRGAGQDWLQAIISYCVGDASAIVKNCAGGHTAWMEFVCRAVFNGVWQWLVIQIVTGGWGVVVCAIIEWVQIKNGKSEMIDRMLTESRRAALKEIRARLDDRLGEMNARIAVKVNAVRDSVCGGERRRLEDERSRLSEIERNMRDGEFSAGREKTRTDKILAELAAEIKSCHEDVFGTPFAGTLSGAE